MEQAVAANTEAEEIAAEFKDYAYSVSHDLSAPVRAMVEFSNMLAQEHSVGLRPETKEYLEIIVDNGRKLQSMMDGLLAFSRLNTMAHPLLRVDCNAVLTASIEMLQAKIHATGAEIEVGQLPAVVGDEPQLVQLFAALLDNALTFRPPGRMPVITVSAEQADGMWKLIVADNGIGIAERYHQRIFRFFQRLHTDEEYPGVGMGLSLARKIVQRHGGTIGCDSQYQNGAAFYVLLPVHHFAKEE